MNAQEIKEIVEQNLLDLKALCVRLDTEEEVPKKRFVYAKESRISYATFATSYWWDEIENRDYRLSREKVAEACGWSEVYSIQFGNILGRLNDLGNVSMSERLKIVVESL